MEDFDLLGFLERKLDSKILKEDVKKQAKDVKVRPEDDLCETRPILTKRVAQLLEGGSRIGAPIGESKKDAKNREKLQKQLNSIQGKLLKRVKSDGGPRKEKPKEEKEEVEKIREKKLVLSKKAIQKNLHLFRGSKVPPSKVKEHKQVVKLKLAAMPEPRPQPAPQNTIIKPEKLKIPPKQPKYREESDDSAMEVRDMYDIDEENDNAFELGQREEEEYEKLLKLRKEYNKFGQH